MFCPCPAFVVPHVAVGSFSELLVLPFMYYGNIITGMSIVSAAGIQFILKFLLIKTFMC